MFFDVEEHGELTRKMGCPWDAVDARAAEVVGLYSHYKKGTLWTSGGLGSQPAPYVMAMKLLDTEFSKMSEEHRRKQERGLPPDARGRR